MTIKLAGQYQLASFGATWFDVDYQDRAPAGVTVAVSTDGIAFTTVASSTSLVFGGSSTLFTVAPVSARYVRYSFDVPGAVNLGNAVAIAQIFAGAVPEPETWSLMITGFALTGFAARRRARLASRA